MIAKQYYCLLFFLLLNLGDLRQAGQYHSLPLVYGLGGGNHVKHYVTPSQLEQSLDLESSCQLGIGIHTKSSAYYLALIPLFDVIR